MQRMFCNACGSQLGDGVKFCPLCGKAAPVATPVADDITSVMPPVAADAQVTAEMPAAPAAYPPAYPPAYPTPAAPPVAPPRQRSAAPVIIAIVLVVLLAMGGGAFALLRSGILGGGAKVDEGVATADDSSKADDSKDNSSTGITDDDTATDDAITPPKGDPVDITPGGSALSASSTLKGYAVSQLVDGKLDTCWAEGVKGYGVGSAISIDLGGEVWVSEVQIVPGYLKYDSAKDVDRWFSNGRVSSAKLVFSDGSESQPFSFDPDKQGWQMMKLSKAVKTGSVKVVILGTAAANTGTDHDAEDTSVSEIKVLGFIPR